MILPQSEIDRITGSKFRRRMMRLPAVRGELGELVRCPLQNGSTHKLQPRAFAPSQATIVILEVRKEKLAAITLADARMEGHASIQAALDAYARTHGPSDDASLVWVVSFARETKDAEVAAHVNSDLPVLMARSGGDYTTKTSRAIKGEGEVLLPLAADLARARAQAVEQRVTPRQQEVDNALRAMGTLRESMTAMKARNRAKLIERELGKLRAEVSAESAATLPASQCGESQRSVAVQDEPRPSTTQSVVSLESAA